ncbi:hypothetical protein [Fictibacillus phosphorivorans]|uniref:hypothetical protein n=1 Tax=Fictibacillus phosphorivorans TaxID=1221500 RepID=UPI00203E2E69|nr:hypothetical protein [Fictibacillus phosphorivorans]MCM3717281.1 hypothetical protein [Fictibacillus phosphorivorans]MCM3774968.1 hypothetical protein [Fictibacillus phosphorivorans]
MDLAIIWEDFFNRIKSDPKVITIEKKLMAGIPFVYVSVVPNTSLDTATDILKEYAVKSMKGKRLSLELFFVRSEENIYVFRMRFLVPQEKMFCCGNLCFDCIRLRNP